MQLTAVHQASDTEANWMQVEAEERDRGALRLARRAEPDVLLCEELKHLYTAITRAKNNIVFFVSNKEKRAPFFYYLRRVGMAPVCQQVSTPPYITSQHAHGLKENKHWYVESVAYCRVEHCTY